MPRASSATSSTHSPTKEAHYFYPLLFYFRFEEPLYAVSRFCFVLLDISKRREREQLVLRMAPSLG